jgi:hypothetical protein
VTSSSSSGNPVAHAPRCSREHGALAAGLVAIGIGLVTVALLGPFGTGVINYHVTETLRNQTVGLDVVSLLVVAPLSLLAALLVARRRLGGAALALGIGAYTSYMLVQYILGPEYERLPGNNERLFPLYLTLFALGWIVALVAWNALDVERLPQRRRRDRGVGRVVLPLLALLAFGRYLPALADWDALNSRNIARAGICKTGATGLEPATSGVTGLFYGSDDWRRLTRDRSIRTASRSSTSATRNPPWVCFRTFAARLLPGDPNDSLASSGPDARARRA